MRTCVLSVCLSVIDYLLPYVRHRPTGSLPNLKYRFLAYTHINLHMLKFPRLM